MRYANRTPSGRPIVSLKSLLLYGFRLPLEVVDPQVAGVLAGCVPPSSSSEVSHDDRAPSTLLRSGVHSVTESLEAEPLHIPLRGAYSADETYSASFMGLH